MAFLLHAARTTEEGRRRVVFAFYTSMREENARPIADYLTGGRRVDIYERKFNKPDRSGSESWDTMRDLCLQSRRLDAVVHIAEVNSHQGLSGIKGPLQQNVVTHFDASPRSAIPILSVPTCSHSFLLEQL